MYQDEVETFLSSSEPAGDYNPEVTLEITAYLRGGASFIDDNTLTFRCDPIGSNYRSSYLQVTFEDWSKVVDIRNFLAESFSDDVISRRVKTIEVEDGVQSITPFNQAPNETEGLEEITIEVNGDRIEFQRSGTVLPYIYTYEEKVNSEPQDRDNAEKLLNFFDEIISLHPDFEHEESDVENPEVGTLFDQHRVEQLLNQIVTSESDLFQDYQKAVREFENGEYADSVRDLGRASEVLIEYLSEEEYDDEDISENMVGRLNKLDKTEAGVPAFIGKTISPLWWLRNQVSHPNGYEPTEEEALYAMLCFQVAVEKYVNN